MRVGVLKRKECHYDRFGSKEECQCGKSHLPRYAFLSPLH